MDCFRNMVYMLHMLMYVQIQIMYL